MSIPEELIKLREEAKNLRQENAVKIRAWENQKKKNTELLEELKGVKNELRDAKKENEKLKEALEAVTNHKDSIAKIIFKSAIEKKGKFPSDRKRGGQLNHQGYGRKKPKKADHEIEAYLSHCPHCQTELNQSETKYERTVEDIPEVETVKVIVTRYTIQRQWCSGCQKEIHANPKNTLPGFRIGLNAIGFILFQKYNQRLPLQKIAESLRYQFGLKLKPGGIQNILHKSRKYFGKEYESIIKRIRKAKVKHADETGWRIEGRNGWCWMFKTTKEVCYVIVETRGKGIPKKILGEKPQGVLVRDDYGAYTKMNMEQQSCWAHLLRVSHDLAVKPTASKEITELHQELKIFFNEIKVISEKTFKIYERKKEHLKYHKKIEEIIGRNYESKEIKDAKAIQTRIANQRDNLITAILHDDVPLTNNSGERQIRQVAIQRKISGGSRSNDGAKTQAVNMSIIQTLYLKGKNVFKGIEKIIQTPAHKFCLERTE